MSARDEARAGRPIDAPEPPFQAVAPNLDRMSRDSFARGTVSRRRIIRASIGLGVVAVAIAGIIVATVV